MWHSATLDSLQSLPRLTHAIVIYGKMRLWIALVESFFLENVGLQAELVFLSLDCMATTARWIPHLA